MFIKLFPVTLVALLLCIGSSFAQNADPQLFGKTITPEDLKKHLTIIAGVDMEGRETGTIGNLKAANYLATQFENMGIPKIGNSYFQPIMFSSSGWDNISLKVREKELAFLWDFYCLPHLNESGMMEGKEVLFLGYGIKSRRYNDYRRRVNVKDKILLVLQGEPLNKDSISYVTRSKEQSDWTMEKKIAQAKKAGAKAILFIDKKTMESINKNRALYMGAKMRLGNYANSEETISNACIDEESAKLIAGEDWMTLNYNIEQIGIKGKSIAMPLQCPIKLVHQQTIKKLEGNNILGYIEGSDRKVKDELVIVSAHNDHLGKRGDVIYYGADDDGSGTVGLIEIAEALQIAKKEGNGPRRSVLVLSVTGEEKGLYGSEYYTNRPVFPLAKTVADVNIDMIGRVDKKHQADENYIYVIGADRLSQDLHDINEMVNKNYTHLALDYTFNLESDPNRYYYRSDHYNFAKNNIPAIFYFNGTHDDYHRPTDTVDKINFNALAKRTQLAFYTVWELANRKERIRLNFVKN